MIRAAVVGVGNTGRAAVSALGAAPDFQLAGVVYHKAKTLGDDRPAELTGVPIVADIQELGPVDVALLCTPTRKMPDIAESLLRRGINTVDSFDIHSEIPAVRERLMMVAQEVGRVAVVSSGWDPGSDSIVRALLQFMAPDGLTYTDFGPGMSMGHSVAARGIPGVRDALSMTIPKGSGLHRRMVYVQLQEGAEADTVQTALLADPYFSRDETHMIPVDTVTGLRSAGSGVSITRSGGSGSVCNQRFSFAMTINNPALTTAVMVASARAALRQTPGAYTLIEIPVVDFLPGARADWVQKLV